MNETDLGADAADRDYFTAIETEFIRRRGSPFLLSPKDFALVRRWQQLGIPIADVRLGIAEAFDRRIERRSLSKINSLAYCEGAVLEAWERNASARVGKGSPAHEERDISSDIVRIADTLAGTAKARPDAADAIARAERSVRKLGVSGGSAEQIERSLSRIEKKLLKEISASLPERELRSIEDEADHRLAGDRETMEPGAFEKTRKILIRRKLRAELGLARLSLLG
jgi:hypothetical protein